VSGSDDVFAGGDLRRELEEAIGVRDGEVGMIKHADVGEHPRVNVAFDAQVHFRNRKREGVDLTFEGLSHIELTIAWNFRSGVNVVERGV
jgi:hypothetical protein